jgi:putative SOS response-associated peptidase YedK
MPVILDPETWPAWLGEEPADARQLKAMLAWPVSPRVGNVKNNVPSLIERIFTEFSGRAVTPSARV